MLAPGLCCRATYQRNTDVLFPRRARPYASSRRTARSLLYALPSSQYLTSCASAACAICVYTLLLPPSSWHGAVYTRVFFSGVCQARDTVTLDRIVRGALRTAGGGRF